MKKITWRQLFRKIQPNYYFGKYNQKKVLLAFEFAIVLSDAANQLKIEMTREIVKRAEDLLKKEMEKGTAEDFACQMGVFVLAVLEPKD